jgi:hypothetical protein
MLLTNKYRKGKTYEEIYGLERSKEIKIKQKHKSFQKGKTYEEM